MKIEETIDEDKDGRRKTIEEDVQKGRKKERRRKDNKKNGKIRWTLRIGFCMSTMYVLCVYEIKCLQLDLVRSACD